MGAFVFVPRASSNPIQSITTSSRCGFSRLEFSPQLSLVGLYCPLFLSNCELLSPFRRFANGRANERCCFTVQILALFPPAALPLPPKIGGH